MNDFLFVDLGSLTPGKPFAGFAIGSFVDMYGQKVVFKTDQLREFLSNTKEAITAALGKGMPGLPIDARQHDKGEAAGWIVDVSEGTVEDSSGKQVPVLMLTAEWTKVGLELIRDRIMANFSPSIDLVAKVIRGGSLTNWPASVDSKGVPLFPAVELAQGMKSLDERIVRVRLAFEKQFQTGEELMWVHQVYETSAVVTDAESQFWSVTYSVTEEGAIEFAPRADWVPVEQVWTPLSDERAEIQMSEGVDMTPEELNEVVARQVKEALAAHLQQAATPLPSGADPKPGFDVLGFLELEGATDEVVDAFRQQMLDQYDLMRTRATQEAAEMIARIRKENDVTEFSAQIVGGTPDVPFGLPVDERDLREFLSHLSSTDYAFAKTMLESIQQQGRHRFAELGHGKPGQVGSVPVPERYARELDAGALKISDLSAPELGLGDISQYDVSRWLANGGK